MPRYSKTVIILHWGMSLLILAAWLTAEGGRQVRLNPPLLHFSLGLAVLLLVLPRMIARWHQFVLRDGTMERMNPVWAGGDRRYPEPRRGRVPLPFRASCGGSFPPAHQGAVNAI